MDRRSWIAALISAAVAFGQGPGGGRGGSQRTAATNPGRGAALAAPPWAQPLSRRFQT
jgi:hypothetical protein